MRNTQEQFNYRSAWPSSLEPFPSFVPKRGAHVHEGPVGESRHIEPSRPALFLRCGVFERIGRTSIIFNNSIEIYGQASFQTG